MSGDSYSTVVLQRLRGMSWHDCKIFRNDGAGIRAAYKCYTLQGSNPKKYRIVVKTVNIAPLEIKEANLSVINGSRVS